MNKEAATIQEKCQECQLAIDKEESYAVFVTEDWRTSFIEYLVQGILFKRGFSGDPLRCLGPREAREVVREVHSDDCGSHLGKRRLYK